MSLSLPSPSTQQIRDHSRVAPQQTHRMRATVKALRILSLYWMATVSCNGLLSPLSYPSTTSKLENYKWQYRPTSITLWAFNSASTSEQTNKRRKGKSNGNGKWDRRRGNNNKKNQQQHGPRPPPKPRPILTIYEEQRDDSVNRQRLSPNTAINCEHFGTCPGCVVDNSIGQVDIVRSAARFFSSTAIRKNRLDVEQSGEDWVVEEEDDGFYQVVIPSDVTQWRTQAKLVAAPRSSSWAKDGCVFGLYKRASHDVLEIPDCQVHHPSINRAVQVLEKATQKAGTPAFNRDSRDANGLRYVQLQVERITGKISLTLVFGVADVKSAQPSLSRLTKQLTKLEPDLWHSIWCHCNDSPGNNIFSRNPRSWHRLSGPEFVREPFPVGDMGWLYFSPLAFRQGNMDGFDVLANDVARAIPGGSKVCELYAGVGLLGLTALMYHHPSNPLVWVRCSDENPANPRCFTRSLQSIPREITEHPKQGVDEPTLTLRDIMEKMEQGEEFEAQGDLAGRVGSKATYSVASAGASLRAGDALGADVLVVDPPRKGLEDDVLEELCTTFNPKQPNVESPNMLTIDDYLVNWTNDVQTFVYVSCGFDALARDTEKLLSSQGGWKLESATGYVLFPGSNHVETLAVFKRK